MFPTQCVEINVELCGFVVDLRGFVLDLLAEGSNYGSDCFGNSDGVSVSISEPSEVVDKKPDVASGNGTAFSTRHAGFTRYKRLGSPSRIVMLMD
jgi:hypothetical protein